jgi:hypothetical protein
LLCPAIETTESGVKLVRCIMISAFLMSRTSY